jgi:diketogulonate reductase-like aldo/keto reductase
MCVVANSSIRTVLLPSGEPIPALGQGTWQMGESAAARDEELRTLQLGLELGLTLIDTAEMYGDGRSEELVADAIDGRRDNVFLVSKVLPSNASRHGTIEACERSLKRLRTDRLDLYLLHWRGRLELGSTIEAFKQLKADGKIRHWGVSNFDTFDMAEIAELGADGAQTNQVLYNLVHRQVEFDLLPWSRDEKIPIMAYSPIDRGRLVADAVVVQLAEKHRVSAAQIALAWVLRHDDVFAVPKASSPDHVRENAGVLEIRLDADDLKLLDEEFPPPHRPEPLPLY